MDLGPNVLGLIRSIEAGCWCGLLRFHRQAPPARLGPHGDGSGLRRCAHRAPAIVAPSPHVRVIPTSAPSAVLPRAASTTAPNPSHTTLFGHPQRGCRHLGTAVPRALPCDRTRRSPSPQRVPRRQHQPPRPVLAVLAHLAVLQHPERLAREVPGARHIGRVLGRGQYVGQIAVGQAVRIWREEIQLSYVLRVFT